MAFDGAGTFLRLRNWVADAAAGVKIRADFHDTEDNNFASGLSNCICKDGQTTVTQNLPMNSKRITALADPINPQDASTKAYADTKLSNTSSGTITGSLTATGNLYANGDLYAGYGAATGSIHFGNNAGYYLNWNGSTFTFSEPLAVVGTLNVSGAANINSALTASGGLYLNANNYAITDGTNHILRSNGSIYFQSVAGATWGYINAGGMNVSGALTVTGGAIQCQPNYSFRSLGGGNGGFGCKAGDTNVTSTDWFNFYWNGSGLAGYVNNTFLGFVAFNSDYRIKKDVVDLPDMWDTVKALRPIKYTQAEFSPPSHLEHAIESGIHLFVADDIERWGFIAHELQETMIPTAASGVKDQPDGIQSPNPWTIIAALTKTIQEMQTRIEALENK